MSAALIRRMLHGVHAVATLLLLATGVVIYWPELRTAMIGGYGQRVLDIHLIAGALFIVSVIAAGAAAGAPLLEDLRRRLGPPDPWGWRKTHIVLALAVSAGLSISGVVLWLDVALPRFAFDAAHWVHDLLTIVIALALVVHLVASRRKIVSRVREWLGLAPPPPEPFDFEDD
ncbi:hypothetical protein MYXO_02096 [Myxococcaceae bacterium]|jgi:cytochrome b subunit of formate dehydrogenase|nr:hypothetical protein MYXO_02096 [Myxococcaceae bacterium]